MSWKVPRIRVDLQDGFDGDEVVVRVAGREVYRDEDVRTLTVIGRAATFTADVPAGKVAVDIELPRRGLEHRVVLDAAETPNLGVSATGAMLTHRVASEPFGYA